MFGDPFIMVVGSMVIALGSSYFIYPKLQRDDDFPEE
jgi:hypothetical protein